MMRCAWVGDDELQRNEAVQSRRRNIRQGVRTESWAARGKARENPYTETVPGAGEEGDCYNCHPTAPNQTEVEKRLTGVRQVCGAG